MNIINKIEEYLNEEENKISYEEFKSKLSTLLDKSSDKKETEREIKKLYNKGFSIADAKQYLKHTEEVNPDIDEEKALKVLNRLSSKYGGKK